LEQMPCECDDGIVVPRVSAAAVDFVHNIHVPAAFA
jgi:hypothetical protein